MHLKQCIPDSRNAHEAYVFRKIFEPVLEIRVERVAVHAAVPEHFGNFNLIRARTGSLSCWKSRPSSKRPLAGMGSACASTIRSTSGWAVFVGCRLELVGSGSLPQPARASRKVVTTVVSTTFENFDLDTINTSFGAVI